MAAWFVSNCLNQPSKRNELVEKLKKYIDIDVYGDCGTFSCPGVTGSSPCDDLLDTTYKFYLSFENSLCVDYITEKVYKVFKRMTIPVVYNGAAVSQFLPPHSYVDANSFVSVKSLAKYLKRLANDPQEYVKFFWWKDFYTANRKDPFPFKTLCQKIHETSSSPNRKSYKSIRKWIYQCSEPKIKF